MPVEHARQGNNIMNKPTKLPVIFEPTHRHIRVKFNNEIIVESRHAMLLRDVGYFIHYFFPESDVQMEYLIPTAHTTHSAIRGDTAHWTVRVGEREAENAAFTYPETQEGRPDMRGYIAFEWNKMEAWFEEDEQVFGHARDPYHRVDAIRSSRHIQVVIDGVLVADSYRPITLFETSLRTRYYIPFEDIHAEYLTPSHTHTYCPYKGRASYYHATINGKEYKDIVWGYPNPLPEALKAQGAWSFYNEKVDVYVDGVLEEK
jgi:uncharacterized protein (DUF427 family)